MKLSVYSIYDEVAQVFNKPFFDLNNGTAIRNFKGSLEQNNFTNANDYVLYHIGEFTDNDAVYVGVKPEPIYTGKTVVQEKNAIE